MNEKLAKVLVPTTLWVIVYAVALTYFAPGWLTILNIVFLVAMLAVAAREDLL
jgi:uncharacterized protein (DUF58 family)